MHHLCYHSLTLSEIDNRAMTSSEHHTRDQRVAAALTALRRNDITTADADLRHLLGALPGDPVVLQLAAAIALVKGDHADAECLAVASLARRPQHVPTLLIAGRAARLAGDLAAADQHFTQALEVEPGRAETAFLICVTRLERGDATARSMLDRLMQEFPEDADGWFEIGASLQRAGKLDAALAAFDRAHHRSDSHLRRGAIYQQREQPQVAIAIYEAALQRFPALAEAWFRLGVLYEDQGDPQRAIRAYQRVLEMAPNLAEAAVNLGLLQQDQGDVDAAFASYRRAMAANPDSFGRIAQGLSAAAHGQMWLDLGKLRQALQS
jgi:tetratricopeptide (TPR) repeat protein